MSQSETRHAWQTLRHIGVSMRDDMIRVLSTSNWTLIIGLGVALTVVAVVAAWVYGFIYALLIIGFSLYTSCMILVLFWGMVIWVFNSYFKVRQIGRSSRR